MAYTDELTAAGLEIMSLEDRIAELEQALKNDISPILDCRAASLMGQLVRIFSERTQAVLELAAAVHSGQNPDTATGFAQTGGAAWTGTRRKEAMKSTIATAGAPSDGVQLAAGATLPTGSVAHVDGDPTARFITDADAVNGGGAPAWIAVDFTAEVTGPIAAPAGKLAVIAEPVTGWLAVGNALDAVEGTNEETHTELRLRRELELQTGSTAVGAILTELTQTEGVLFAAVLENDTDFVDAQGLPPHSIHAVVHAPTLTDAQVAAVVFTAKAAGIRAAGSTVVAVTDSQGNDHAIGFSRATVLDLYVGVTLTYTAADYADDDVVKLAIADYGDLELGVGGDVLAARIIDTIIDVAGVVDVDVTAVKIDVITPPVAVGNYAVGVFQLADLDTGRITVHSSEA